MFKVINETECTFETKEGKKFTVRGAYLDLKGGIVYIVNRDGHLIVTDWHGNLISANVQIVSTWTRYFKHGEPYTMSSIRFSTAPGINYSGRYNSDWGQACKVKRTK